MIIAALLVGCAVVLGGGGSPWPLPEMLLQGIAALACAVWVVLSPLRFPFVSADRRAWVIAGLLIVLPLVQMIPLPPMVWQALPGRELTRESLALVGAQDSWHPWSLDPLRTLASLLALLPAAAFMLMVAGLRRGGRATVMAMIASMSLLGLVVGAGQLAGGEANAFRFYERDVGFLNGFQANHNAAADVFLIAMVAAVATVREYGEFKTHSRLTQSYRLLLSAGLVGLFTIGVFLTGSRAGILLLPVAWAGVLAIVWPWLRFDRKALRIGGAISIVAVLVIVAIFAQAGVVERVVRRFGDSGELRPQIWHDTLFVIRQYFPWGVGMGGFVPAFVAVEPLEVIDATLTNRAHNDYLEILVEGGIFAAMLLAAISWNVAGLLRQAWQECPASSRSQVVFSTTALAVIALHSIVDYPLRSMSLAFLAAAAVALLMPAPRGAETGNADV
ncbi:O-antigen ligase [Novosphingobium sp. TH158]|uniref:O-antigen ligase family protein n=1 Tax=Novosphingobium sp. TH158 TaxID=2067455 RepID=UPI001C1F379B|nr:O-antigen ligase family protein [Novosphingobium sp. TH158]